MGLKKITKKNASFKESFNLYLINQTAVEGPLDENLLFSASFNSKTNDDSKLVLDILW